MPGCTNPKGTCRGSTEAVLSSPTACDFCKEQARREKANNSPVRREGSSLCRCGSLASGGSRTYCTCDTCF